MGKTRLFFFFFFFFFVFCFLFFVFCFLLFFVFFCFYFFFFFFFFSLSLTFFFQDIEKAQFPLLIPREFFELEGEFAKGFEEEVTHSPPFPSPSPLLLSSFSPSSLSLFPSLLLPFQVFWVTHGGLKPLDIHLAMRPTSETPMYYMFSKWIRTYRDLPLKIHQTCSVFR